MVGGRKKISMEQLEFLDNQANKEEVYEVPLTLHDLIGRKEALDPRWKHIWASIGERAYEETELPREWLEEIDDAMDTISAMDDGIKKLHLKSDDQVCLLLGAGASAAAPSSIPTVAHLLPELWRRAGKIGREDIDQLVSWCNSNSVSNIEDLLTAAYLANFAAKNTSITRLLGHFLFWAKPSTEKESSSIALLQDTLQVLFGLLTGTMIPAPPNPGHNAVVEFIRNHPHTSIVTTNYDGCVDEALIRANVAPTTYVEESTRSSCDSVDLIKIHGSINWSYCDSCHQVREFPLLDLKQAYVSDSSSYAVIGICKNCGGQRRPLLIPPMGLKFIMFPTLIQLWNAARERLEGADLIIVVGFSFSEADTYITKIIERSMTRKGDQKLIICDPNPELLPSLQRRFAARIDGFDQSRVLGAMGSSDELLPQILRDLVAAGTKVNETKPKSVPLKSSEHTGSKPKGSKSKHSADAA